MHVLLDQDACVGSGQCALYAPEVFDQREDDGVAMLLTDEPVAHQLEGVREAARLCPAAAIQLEE